MRMKRFAALSLTLGLLAGLLSGCSGTSSTLSSSTQSVPEPQSAYKFTVSNFYAAVNNHGLLGKAWCDEITARTDGLVTFDYYPGASLVADNSSYDSIKNGIVDIAMFSTASTPGVFPAMSMLEAPQGYENGWVGTMVANEFLDEFSPAEFSGVKPLYIHTVSPLVILGNKPVNKVSDFEGMIIRSGSELATNTANALKGQAYSCQITELYEALTKGMCDAAISGVDTLTGFNLGEVVKYVYRDPSYGKIAVVATCMNETKWNSLPEDIQKIFEEVSDDFAQKQGYCWIYEDEVALKKFESEQNGQVVRFDEAIQAELQAVLQPVNDAFIANSGLNANITDSYRTFLTERIAYYNANQPKISEVMSWGESYLVNLEQ